jgi:methyl-accepting chemotaxis protein
MNSILQLFDNFTLKAKIIFLVGVTTSLMAFAILFSMNQMANIGDEIEAIAERDLPVAFILSEIAVNQLEQEVHMEAALRFGLLLEHESTAARHLDEAIAEFNTRGELVNEEFKKGEELLQGAIEQTSHKQEREEFEHALDLLTQIDKEHHGFEEAGHHIFGLIKQHAAEHEIEVAAEKAEQQAVKMNNELEGLLFEIEEFTEQAAITAEEHEHHAESVLLMLLVGTIVVSAAVSYVMILSIMRNVQQGVTVVTKIASGDLHDKVHVTSKDEIGQMLASIAEMRDNLHDIVSNIESASSDVAATAEELSVVNEETSEGVSQQQKDTDQLATAINQMTSTIGEVANNTNMAAESAQNANQEAQRGQQVVNGAIESINLLAEEVSQSAQAIHILGEDSESIGSVVDVITGIAEQTNLLALNAAIEAARAGEQGRGFAVVADEVRTLAQRTHEATTEIQTMITRLQAGARASVERMETSSKQMETSVEQAAEAGAVLESILKAITGIADMNHQIASAAEEQTAVSEDINRKIITIRDIAEHTGVTVHQTAEASTELATTASKLTELVNRFKL